jgi:hypothetical protein
MVIGIETHSTATLIIIIIITTSPPLSYFYCTVLFLYVFLVKGKSEVSAVFKHQTIARYVGVEAKFHAFVTSALYGELSSYALWPLYPD